jgi:hypothetical protein
MRLEQVEIYSDTTNMAVMRHPGRNFPGVLVQGDTLHGLCSLADKACGALRGSRDRAAIDDAKELRDHLRDLLAHYKRVLGEHHIELPFEDRG